MSSEKRNTRTASQKTPRDAKHVIIEGHVSDASDDGGKTASTQTDTADKVGSKRGRPKVGLAIIVVASLGLAGYAVWDGWQLRRQLAELQNSSASKTDIQNLRVSIDDLHALLETLESDNTANVDAAIVNSLNRRLVVLSQRVAALEAAATDGNATATTPPIASESPSPIVQIPPATSTAVDLSYLTQAIASGLPYDELLADYLPHYPALATLAAWADSPPPSRPALWEEYNVRLAGSGRTTPNPPAASNEKSSWWGRAWQSLIASATDDIHLTPLEDTGSDLFASSQARDLPAAIAAARKQTGDGWADWAGRAEARLQLDAALAHALASIADQNGGS